jgi:capsular exopolysaccharide synthesis family protein
VVADLLGGRRLGTVDDVVAVYPLEVLARVPHVRAPSGRGKTPARRPALREAFRTLAVQVTMREGDHSTIMLTSASQGDGKTTSAIAFALELAEAGHDVVLIDGDLRKPDIALRLDLHVEHGLEDVAAGRTPLEDALVPVPGVERLRVLSPSGPLPLVTVAGTGRTFHTVLTAAEAVATYVVLDTPPVGEVSDALTLARDADDLVVVCRLGHTTELQLRTARELLDRTQLAPTGVVVVG